MAEKTFRKVNRRANDVPHDLVRGAGEGLGAVVDVHIWRTAWPHVVHLVREVVQNDSRPRVALSASREDGIVNVNDHSADAAGCTQDARTDVGLCPESEGKREVIKGEGGMYDIYWID